MNKTKTAAAAFLLTVFIASSTAISYNPGTDQPINNTYDNSIENVSVNQQYFNSSIDGNQLTITGQKVIPSNTYSVNLTFTDNNTTQFPIKVPEYNNFELKPVQLEDTLSIGSSGQLTKINITGNGNTVTESQIKLNGNITEFLTLLDKDKFIPTSNKRPVNIVYDIPRNQRFGTYTGNLNVSTSQKSENVSIVLDLSDDIPPTIETSTVNDLMATNTESFTWTVKDNLQVENGSISVYRVEERTVNSTTGETEMVNVSVDESDLVQSSDDSSLFTYSFENSSVIGDYFAKVVFRDESSNKVNDSYGFRVNGLDSVNVLNSDFRFEDSRPRNNDNPSRVVEKQVFTKNSDKQLNVSISEDFTVSGNNSVTVGIRESDQTNPTILVNKTTVKDKATLTESGTYYLVVYSNDAGFSYSGTLNLELVPQHVSIDDSIEFSGSFVDPEYPPLPENRSLGSFEGSLEFLTNDNGVPTGLRFEGQQFDISDCKGVDSWGDCIPGYSLGEIPEVKQENQRLKRKAGFMQIVGFSAVFWTFFVVLNNFSKGTRMVGRKVPESEIGEVVNDVSNLEV